MAEPGCKGGFIHLSQLLQAWGKGESRRLEGRLLGRFRSEVERTDIQAIIASEDLISHALLELFWDRGLITAQFDREVRNAACGVDSIRLNDGFGRAGLDTESAASTEIGGRFVGFQFERGENLSQDQP